MPLIRTQNNVPEIYETSRDFQYLGRLFDLVLNGVKYYSDSIADISNTRLINSRLLDLLQTKLGFFTKAQMINEDDLRYVLRVFPQMIRKKGSLEAIQTAVNVFMKIKSFNNYEKSKNRIYIVNDEFTPTYGNATVDLAVPDEAIVDVENTEYDNTYVVTIEFNSPYVDTTILDELLYYVLPAGYIVRYEFYSELNITEETYTSDINSSIVITPDSVGSSLRASNITSYGGDGLDDMELDDDRLDATKSVESSRYENTDEEHMINVIGTTELIGSEKEILDNLPETEKAEAIRLYNLYNSFNMGKIEYSAKNSEVDIDVADLMRCANLNDGTSKQFVHGYLYGGEFYSSYTLDESGERVYKDIIEKNENVLYVDRNSWNGYRWIQSDSSNNEFVEILRYSHDNERIEPINIPTLKSVSDNQVES